MALTTEQKVDLLLKKLGYTKTKTGSVFGTGSVSGTGKQPFGEAIPSPLIVANGSLWNEADLIPATPPGSDTNQVKRYSTTSALRMTLDTTVTPNRSFIAYTTYNNTSSARLTNWIDTQFGPDYQLEVYVDDATDPANKLPEGGSGSNDGWYFDYSAGVLNFSDTNIPSGVNGAGTNVYIVGYRYIGKTGATVLPSLDVAGVSTFRDAINALDIIKGYKYLAAPYSGTTTTLTVTVATKINGEHIYHGQGSSLGYVIDGLQSPFFTLTPGRTYRFDQSDSSNNFHQLRFYLEADKTTLYEEGVTYAGTAGSSGAYTEITISDTTPVVLHYQCVNHGFMGNAFQSNTNVVNTNYEATIRSGLNVSGVSTFSNNIDANGNLDVDGHTELDDVNISGVTTFAGEIDANGKIVGAQLANVIPFYYDNVTDFPSASTYHGAVAHAHNTGKLYFAHAGWKEIVSKEANGTIGVGTEVYNIGTLTVTGDVSIGGTLTYEDVTNIDAIGIITARAGIDVTGGVIEALAGENKIPSLYANMAALPSASTYHGMFAHVHSQGKGYFAHGGAWYELVNKELNGTIGVGTEVYNIGVTSISTLNVLGVSTFAGNVDINADIDVDGHTNLDNVNIAGVTTFTGNIDANGDLDVDGHTNLDNVSIAGVTTFSNQVYFPYNVNFLGQNSGRNIVFRNGNTILDFSDSAKITMGDDGDLEIYHSPSGSVIKDAGTGNLQILGSAVYIGYPGGNGIEVVQNGEVELRFNNNPKLNTTNTGVTVTGTLVAGGADINGHTNLDNVNIVGVTTHEGHVLPSADSTYDLGSSSKYWRHVYADNIGVGTDGTTIGVDIVTRNLQVNGISTHVGIATFNDATFHGDIDVDGQTELDNVNIVGVTTVAGDILPATTNSFNLGTNNNGGIGNGRFKNAYLSSSVWILDSSAGLILGDTMDTKFYHDGNGTKIDHSGTGSFGFRSNNGFNFSCSTSAGETAMQIIRDGAIKLYHNQSGTSSSTLRFETTTTGINIIGNTETDTLNTGNATFTGTISAGGATGNNGQYLKTTGTGVAWASFPTLRTRDTQTASGGQTTFNFNYTVNFIDVYVNGIKLTDSEFTATNGTQVILAVGCFIGDIVELVSYNGVSTGSASGSLNNVVEDITPQLGGNLDLFNKTINGTGNINIVGVATATKFIGDGSGLTGVTASGSGIIVKDSGSLVGTAQTIDFGTNLSLSPASAGIVTVTATNTQLTTEEVQDIVGAMFTGNTETDIIATYQDSDGTIDLVSSSGITTAEVRSNTLVVSGVTTASGGVRVNADGSTSANYISAGASDDLKLFHSSGNSIIHNSTGYLELYANAATWIKTTQFNIIDNDATHYHIRTFKNDRVELYHNNVKRLQTSSVGVSIPQDLDVDGHTELDNVNVSGVITATTFKGALEATSGSFSSNIDANGDLDVDGHTNLDNVSVAGVTTFASGTVFTGAIDANGDLDVDGHTNLDNVSVAGVITATTFKGVIEATSASFSSNIDANGDLDVDGHTDLDNLSVSGISTFTDNVIIDADNKILQIGDGQDLELLHTGTDSIIRDTTGKLRIRSNDLKLEDGSSNDYIECNLGADVILYYNNNAKLATTNTGVTVTGTVVADGADINGDLDVDGHTDLDNVSIAGVTTFSNNVHVGTGITFETNGQATYTGIVTALKFVGDGSGLTNLPGGGSYGNNDVDNHLNVSGASSGQILSWNGSDYAWVADQTGGGGGSQNLFSTIAVSGQNNVVADATSDTLTLVGGTNVTITTNDVTDTITIASAGINTEAVQDIVGAMFTGNTETNITATYQDSDGTIDLVASNANIGITTNLSGSFTASAGSASNIDSYAYSADDAVVEYTVFIKNGSNFQSQKLLAMRDGTTTHSTQFAVMFSSSLLVQFDTTISGGNIILRATPETGVSGSTTYRVKREVL